MIAAVLSALLALLLIGWVLRTNAHDRKTFEKRLEKALADDSKE